ncbi:hypothetical protein GCM10009682_04740 [Luedemannella flava]|uniref:Tetratricopeptide repeat protein n=1 Tax=Luedemannella flava TaxID=349316 RepID=A0ABP4XK63_9ACTN
MRLPDPEHTRIVLAGTGNYGYGGLSHLPAVPHNVVAFAETFADRRLCGVPEHHIRALINPNRPTTVASEIQVAATDAADLLFVYLAGNVVPVGATEPALALAMDFSGTSTGSSFLDLRQVAQTVAASRAYTRVLVLDLRIVAPPELEVAVRETIARQVHQPGVAVLLAATADDNTYDSPGRAGTAFTRAMLDVAHRRDNSGQFYVNLVGLYEQAAERMQRAGKPAPKLMLARAISDRPALIPAGAGPTRTFGGRVTDERSLASKVTDERDLGERRLFGRFTGGRSGRSRGQAADRGADRRAALDPHEHFAATVDTRTPMVLFANASPTAPAPEDLHRIWMMREAAAAAERDYQHPDLALDHYRALVLHAQRVLGPDDRELMGVRQRLAYWVGMSGVPAHATDLLRDLHADQLRLLGPEHPETVSVSRDLTYWSQR